MQQMNKKVFKLGELFCGPRAYFRRFNSKKKFNMHLKRVTDKKLTGVDDMYP